MADEFIRDPGWDRGPGFERETAFIRGEIERIIVPGSGQLELEHLLSVVPQRNREGRLRYLPTAGVGVELITGREREHHDLDLVIMDGGIKERWDIFGTTDNVTPEWYWAEMRFEPKYLANTSWMTYTKPNKILVEVVHPAIILIQKLSNAFGRDPRKKDYDDVDALIRFARMQKSRNEWNPIIEHALAALPVDQIDRTFKRLQEVLK